MLPSTLTTDVEFTGLYVFVILDGIPADVMDSEDLHAALDAHAHDTAEGRTYVQCDADMDMRDMTYRLEYRYERY